MYNKLVCAMCGKKAVSVIDSGIDVCVRHYNTNIVMASPGRIVLSSGGHFTATTKRHINNCLAALGSIAQVYQRDYVWYIQDGVAEQVFFDGYIVKNT